MGSRGTEIDEPVTADATPTDVAALYSWANLQGAKYRDYSAFRREHRAKSRYLAAKNLLDRELKSQAEAEKSAERAEHEAFVAEAVARSKEDRDSQSKRLELLRTAEAASRKAAENRVQAAQHAVSVARATMSTLREEREITEAQASALQQAHIYSESERRKRLMAGPQPNLLPGGKGDADGLIGVAVGMPSQEAEHGDTDSAGEQEAQSSVLEIGQIQENAAYMAEEPIVDPAPLVPAWFYAADADETVKLRSVVPAGSLDPVLRNGIDESEDGMVARWSTLNSLLAEEIPEFPRHTPRTGEVRAPIAVVFSIAGGVGKTSLAAALSRILSSNGREISLADVSAQHLLPFYFGITDLKPGVWRSVDPPDSRTARTIALSSWAMPRGDEAQVRSLARQLLRSAEGTDRLLIDMTYTELGLLNEIADLHPVVLIPLLPDVNAVLGLRSVEKLFESVTDRSGRPLLPFYVLNQFDVSLPLHLDVREILGRKLGERLLPYTVRRSPAVGESVAEGKTVLEYAPNSPVAGDYRDVGHWLGELSPRPTVTLRNIQWGER